jgi:hypothetical protein
MTQQTTTAERALDRFLAQLAKTGNVSQACKAARVGRKHVYTVRQQDPEFADRWLDAIDQAADGLEQEAYRRAVLGWDEEVYTNTGYQGTVHKFDSSLLQLMLKASKPEKYRENIKISGGVLHSIVPSGDARTLAQQLLDVVGDIPAAREAVSLRLLASGE